MWISILLVVFVICDCLIQAKSEDLKRETSSMEAVVNEWMAKQPGGGVAATLISPENTQFFYAGNLLPTCSAPPNENTLFEIGSVTKGFTGLLLADQVLSKKVSLDDTLAKLLTDWPGRMTSAAGSITLLQLATHTSGLARLPGQMNETYIVEHADNPYATYNIGMLYTWLDTVDTVTPGTYDYSNAGFGILGHALTVVNGKSFEELLKERVLMPFGLKDTTITLDTSQRTRLAPPHDGTGKPNTNWDFDVLAPCGALRSSITDLQYFLRVATGIEQNDTSIQDIFKFATEKWENTTIGHLTIGLGWHRSQLQDKLLVWHNGATGGYNSFVAWYPEQKIGVAVIVNTARTEDNNAETLGVALLNQKLPV